MIEAMLQSLDEVLGTFAQLENTGEDNARRLDNLRRLLEIAADFRALLFGQPCGWELGWTMRMPDETSIEMVNAARGQPNNSKVSEQVANTPGTQYGPFRNDCKPQPASLPQRRRRKRLGRTHSTKEGKTREYPHQDRQHPLGSSQDGRPTPVGELWTNLS